ncbi:MAG: hypothetical protein NC132_05075 [Corallococcus sp.]|nr:hypothetical protein [Corallococcus sp.]MCM1360143.1 hypothetical protein [Corallococcus sp.]MCM1395469.1 hypothetical protein [Corallococcus sp.]
MITIFTSACTGFMQKSKTDFCACPTDLNTVTVRTAKTYQTHMGFGGAFTEATAQNFFALDEKQQKLFVDAYFSADGLRYNLGRIPVHSCDFSPAPRTYVKEGDETLSSFDMSWEDEKRIPLIKLCQKAAENLTFFAAPWSPPAYMKTNGDICHGGKLKDEYRALWAEYYARFLEGLKQRGIDVSFASVQNEPEALQTWESRLVDATEEALDIRDYLAPAFKKHGLNVKFIIWDHNRDRMVARAVETLSVDGVADLVWGLGYHWYCCDKSENIADFKALYPDKHVLLTECCVELAHDSTTGKSSVSGLWEHGERYGKNILKDLANGSEGYIDWNMLLNAQGGPTHVGNYCESPLMSDKNNNLVYNPSYWYIGHFSRFIDAGAKRVFCSAGKTGILAVAYVNPDGRKVVVAMNVNDRDEDCCFDVDGRTFRLNLTAHSIVTATL